MPNVSTVPIYLPLSASTAVDNQRSVSLSSQRTTTFCFEPYISPLFCIALCYFFLCQNRKEEGDWNHLEKKGVLRKTLVDNVFSKFIQQGLVKNDILDMMERFGLIAKFVTPTDITYFVPAQLKRPPEDLCEMKPSPSDPCPLYIDFLYGFVPHGLFYQLVSRCIHWCSKNGFKLPPSLFCNGARFFIEKDVFYHLILFCKKRFIKIVLKQIKPNRGAPLAEEEEVPLLVRRLLEHLLQDLSSELPSLENLKYKFCVACPYCPEEERRCDKHDQTSCVHEDCLCLLEMVPAERLICVNSFSDEMRMVPGLEKWFSSEVSFRRQNEYKPL